ncbi:MAG TPA: GTP-binding protein, partial [Blastococcus sp.]|nr:GTP-binding protein [Blastococcus sp.]
MPTRDDLRNVAIIAHVDHGKTTLVDALLRQAGALGRSKGEGTDNDSTQDRVMDSMDLERERGITILAKNTAIRLADENGNPVVVNIVDTPGHADFGGEVERGLSMVDGVVLLVDASEGPLPQTRFVLRKALGKGMPVILAVNKTDRGDARIAEVVDECYELFMELMEDAGMDADALEFPIVYCNGRTGQASLNRPENGTVPDSPDLGPLVKTLLDTVPAPSYDAEEPLRAQVTNLDASPFLGRLALLRIHSGEMKRGQQVAWCKIDGTIKNVKITELLVTEGLTRTPADSAGPGELVAIAGIEDIMIGDTLADPSDPRPLPPLTVDEPSISITIGINTSP